MKNYRLFYKPIFYPSDKLIFDQFLWSQTPSRRNTNSLMTNQPSESRKLRDSRIRKFKILESNTIWFLSSALKAQAKVPFSMPSLTLSLIHWIEKKELAKPPKVSGTVSTFPQKSSYWMLKAAIQPNANKGQKPKEKILYLLWLFLIPFWSIFGFSKSDSTKALSSPFWKSFWNSILSYSARKNPRTSSLLSEISSLSLKMNKFWDLNFLPKFKKLGKTFPNLPENKILNSMICSSFRLSFFHRKLMKSKNLQLESINLESIWLRTQREKNS